MIKHPKLVNSTKNKLKFICGQLKLITQCKLRDNCNQFRKVNFRAIPVDFVEEILLTIKVYLQMKNCGQLKSIMHSKIADYCSQFRITNLRTIAVNFVEKTDNCNRFRRVNLRIIAIDGENSCICITITERTYRARGWKAPILDLIQWTHIGGGERGLRSMGPQSQNHFVEPSLKYI